MSRFSGWAQGIIDRRRDEIHNGCRVKRLYSTFLPDDFGKISDTIRELTIRRGESLQSTPLKCLWTELLV